MSERIVVKKSQAGFTLVELMVVITIVGLLAAVSIPNLLKRFLAGRVAAATGDLGCIGNALDNYAQANPASPVPTTLDTYAGLASVSTANGCWIPREDDPDFSRKHWDPWEDSVCFVAPGVWIRCRDLIAHPLGGDGQVLGRRGHQSERRPGV